MHCRKAAGSSIAACLAPFLGPEDLHLGTWPEAFEQGFAPNRKARRDLLHPTHASGALVLSDSPTIAPSTTVRRRPSLHSFPSITSRDPHPEQGWIYLKLFSQND